MVKKEPSPLYKLAQQSLANSDRWFGDTPIAHSIPHLTLAMCGEVGEVANVVKKIDRGSVDINDTAVRYELGMEMADVFIYFLNLCGLLKIDPQAIYDQKQAENEHRFVKEREQREKKDWDIVDGIRVKRFSATRVDE